MNTVIFGSRTIEDYELLKEYIQSLNLNISKIISGGARGIDNLAIRFSKEYFIPLEVLYAQWNKHGKSAGYIRNKEMFDQCDIGICFWDEKSKGTKHMIDLFYKYKKPLYLKIIN